MKKGENDLALRFDLTVSLAKYVTEYYDKLRFYFKQYEFRRTKYYHVEWNYKDNTNNKK